MTKTRQTVAQLGAGLRLKTGVPHVLAVVRPQLRVVLTGYDAKGKKDVTLQGVGWKLSGAATANGKTAADGLIQHKVPITAASAVIEATYPGPTDKVVAEPKPATAPEDYPIKITPDAFKDEEKGDVLEKDADRQYKWTLTVVDLGARNDDEHIRGRLVSLGFPADKDTKAAVQAYQWLYKDDLDGSGALADIKADVKKRYDEV